MTRTVRRVVPAAGASVWRRTTMLPKTNTSDSTTIGMTIPKITTRLVVAFSALPSSGRPSRRRRTHPTISIATAPRKTTEAMASIHHHRVRMSCAGPLWGESEFCCAARKTQAPIASSPLPCRGFARNRQTPVCNATDGRGVVPTVPPAPLDSLERLADTWALDDPTERKRMLIIVNPYATTVSVRLKNLVIYALQGRYEVTAAETTGRGHATELCREAADEDYDVVVAFGGDGTVNEAANGLAGSAVPLTCLPGGATNGVAKMTGTPGEIVDATEHLLRIADDWHPRRVDLPRVAHASPDGSGRCRHF